MLALELVVIILSVLSVCVIIYATTLIRQIKNIGKQLEKRLAEKNARPVTVELMNNNLTRLVKNINSCLKAEEDLRIESNREEKQVKELIANISHDLRTPVTAIRGYLQLMEKGGLTEEQLRKLKITQKHAEELGGLIESFFEYSRLVSVEPELNAVRINLTNLAAECLAGSVDAFEEKNLNVRFIENGPVFCFADTEMTTRIIRNLIKNCVSYAVGEAEVIINAGEYASATFKNPVSNPDEIDTAKLFDRFYTADRARGAGTGLGLFIVKHLAEKMGGGAAAALNDGVLEIKVWLPLTE